MDDFLKNVRLFADIWPFHCIRSHPQPTFLSLLIFSPRPYRLICPFLSPSTTTSLSLSLSLSLLFTILHYFFPKRPGCSKIFLFLSFLLFFEGRGFLSFSWVGPCFHSDLDFSAFFRAEAVGNYSEKIRFFGSYIMEGR